MELPEFLCIFAVTKSGSRFLVDTGREASPNPSKGRGVQKRIKHISNH